jgi:hypothetical protein
MSRDTSVCGVLVVFESPVYETEKDHGPNQTKLMATGPPVVVALTFSQVQFMVYQ